MTGIRIHEPCWKSEYVADTISAKAFLERNFSQTQEAPIKITDIGTSLYADNRQTRECLLRCSSTLCGQSLHIDNFQSAHSGYDHGLMGVKAEIGVMKEKNAQWLLAKNVGRKGSGFWAHLGFLPLLQKHDSLPSLVEKLQDSLEKLFAATDFFAGTVTREIAENYRIAALHFPLHVWRGASQCPNRNNIDEPGHRLFFETLQADGISDYILFPGDSATRRILKRHLGTLPSFPAMAMPPDQEHFSRLYSREKREFPKFAKGREFHTDLPLGL